MGPEWAVLILALGMTYLVLIAALALAGRGALARELAALLPNLALLFRGLLTDQRVPWHAKALVALAALWIASPIDLVPEFIPIAGPLDDAIVAALVLRYLVRSAGREVVGSHWRGDHATLQRLLRLAGR